MARMDCHWAGKSSQQNQTTQCCLILVVKLDSVLMCLCVCAKKVSFLSWVIRPVFADPVTIKERRVVADICRYSSGPLIPTFQSIAVVEIGIKDILENLHVSATTLLSSIFIYMIPTDSKITNYSLYLFVYFLESMVG